jgi:hypothetical protein
VKEMALIKKNKENVHLIKISPTDPQGEWLLNKLVEGANVKFTTKETGYGEQLVISVPGDVPGRDCKILELDQTAEVAPDVNLVLVYANRDAAVDVILPDPAMYFTTLSIVCVANERGINIVAKDGSSILDQSNMDLNYPGDAVTLACNRRDMWYCVGRYHANWYY